MRDIFIDNVCDFGGYNVPFVIDGPSLKLSKCFRMLAFSLALSRSRALALSLSRSRSLSINQSFLMGVFPDQMKIAKIVPVFKAGNKKILNNYRPISILPAFSKILEKLVSIRLINFLESQNILYKHQYGFRQNYSTIQPILHLLNDISTANDNKSKDITLAIFFRHVEGI